jgi:hypothetical protein
MKVLRHILGVAAFTSALAGAQAFADTIDFTTLPLGPVAGDIVFPEATFSSSTGELYVGADGIDHEICAFVSSTFTCEADVTVDFTTAVNDLKFDVLGFDPGDSVTLSVFDGGGTLLGTSIIASNETLDLSGFGSVGSLFLENTGDGAGVAYDHFTFNESSPVPEPAAWTLMVGAFAGFAFAWRRRRAIA